MQKEIFHQSQSAQLNIIISQVRDEAQANAAVKYSSHIDGLIRHITRNELSSVEIVELLHHESQKLHEAGLNYRRGSCR